MDFSRVWMLLTVIELAATCGPAYAEFGKAAHEALMKEKEKDVPPPPAPAAELKAVPSDTFEPASPNADADVTRREVQ